MASLFSVFCDLRGRRVHWVPETSGFCQTAVFTVTHAKSLSLRIMWVFGHFFTCHPILGDPGADSGGERKYKRAGKCGTKKSKERREELFSPFFSFLRAIFSRPFSLPSPPLSAPGSPRMVPAHINTVGDFQSDWRKCNPIKSAKVNGNRKKHRSVTEVYLAVSAVGQHRKFPPHARKT